MVATLITELDGPLAPCEQQTFFCMLETNVFLLGCDLRKQISARSQSDRDTRFGQGSFAGAVRQLFEMP